MGKGTILEHLGEGQYRVKLLLAQDRITLMIQKLAGQIIDLGQPITDARAAMNIKKQRLNSLQSEANDAVIELNQRTVDLRQAVENAQHDVTQKQEALDRTQRDLDELLEQKKLDPESVTAIQIAFAQDTLENAQAALKIAQAVLTDAQKAWDSRSTDYSSLEKIILEAARAREDYRIAKSVVDELLLKRMQREKKKAWLESKHWQDPEVTAWCADFTETLSGDVGTIEIPGERFHNGTAPVMIRPGYQSRATYQQNEQHLSLIQARANAWQQLGKARETLDLGRKAQTIQYSKLKELQRLQQRESQKPRPDEAFLTLLVGQIAADEATLEVCNQRVQVYTDYVSVSLATFNSAVTALANARAAEEHPRVADGRLQGQAAQAGPFSWFFNQALLPGWERWMPMYRIGTLTAISGTTGTVAMDDAKSSQQGLNVNREPILTNVPFEYMECNKEAFEVGDRVVVEFIYHQQDRPKIIGFEEHPRPCALSKRFIFEVRGRDPERPNHAPKSFGKQAFTPTEEQPTQPPSAYAPFGYLPKDDGELLEFVTIQGSSGETNAWTVKHRVRRETIAWGNRRCFAFDGETYKGCVSYPGKSVMGDGWLTRSATYAGEYFGSRISDYMTQKEASVNCKPYQICWNGRIVVDWKDLPQIQYADENQIVAACAVKKTIDEADRWFIRFIVVSLDEPGPIVNPNTGTGKPSGWRTNRQYCRAENVAFRVFEAPVDGRGMQEKLALIVQVGEMFHPDEDLWVPNKADYGSFDINFIDSTEYNRPQMPLGQFSQDGAACTILVFGGIFHNYSDSEQSTIHWHLGIVGLCRLTFNEDGFSQGWTVYQAERSTSASRSLAEDWSSGAQDSSYTSSGALPIAVDYDGLTEVLLWRTWETSSTGSSGFINDETTYNVFKSADVMTTHSITSNHGKISIEWNENEPVELDLVANLYTHAYNKTNFVLQEVDLVTGDWMGFSLVTNYDEDASGDGIATIEITKTINILRNAETIYTATNAPLVLIGNAGAIRGDYIGLVESAWENMDPGTTFTFNSTDIDVSVDVSSGYLDLAHYGKGPAWMHARDHAGNTLTVLAYNEWAPYLTIPGSWYENGGFRPNTTQHRVFWSTGDDFDPMVSWEALMGLDTVVYSLGYV